MPIAVLASVWYSTRDFLMLTAAIMVVITFQVIVEKLVKKEVSKLLFISWCLVIPFGAMTLLLRDPIFLQWKFSIVHWLLGSILLGSYLFKGPVALKIIFFIYRTKITRSSRRILAKCHLFYFNSVTWCRNNKLIFYLFCRFSYVGKL